MLTKLSGGNLHESSDLSLVLKRKELYWEQIYRYVSVNILKANQFNKQATVEPENQLWWLCLWCLVSCDTQKDWTLLWRAEKSIDLYLTFSSWENSEEKLSSWKPALSLWKKQCRNWEGSLRMTVWLQVTQPCHKGELYGRWAWSVLGVIELLGWPRSHLPMAVRSFPILESETPSPCTSSLFSTWSGALSSDCFINSHFWLSEAKSTGKHTLPLQF